MKVSDSIQNALIIRQLLNECFIRKKKATTIGKDILIFNCIFLLLLLALPKSVVFFWFLEVINIDPQLTWHNILYIIC